MPICWIWPMGPNKVARAAVAWVEGSAARAGAGPVRVRVRPVAKASDGQKNLKALRVVVDWALGRWRSMG